MPPVLLSVGLANRAVFFFFLERRHVRISCFNFLIRLLVDSVVCRTRGREEGRFCRGYSLSLGERQRRLDYLSRLVGVDWLSFSLSEAPWASSLIGGPDTLCDTHHCAIDADNNEDHEHDPEKVGLRAIRRHLIIASLRVPRSADNHGLERWEAFMADKVQGGEINSTRCWLVWMWSVIKYHRLLVFKDVKVIVSVWNHAWTTTTFVLKPCLYRPRPLSAVAVSFAEKRLPDSPLLAIVSKPRGNPVSWTKWNRIRA